jgi:hypothetical protein
MLDSPIPDQGPPLATGPVPPPPVTLEAWSTLVADFEAGCLPWSAWRHPQHLAVTSWYIWHEGLATATIELPGRIRAFNASHGVVTTLTRGYHETLTRFWLLRVADVWDRRPALEAPLEAHARVQTELADKNLPFSYYSRERLMSKEARKDWLAPDLQAL